MVDMEVTVEPSGDMRLCRGNIDRATMQSLVENLHGFRIQAGGRGFIFRCGKEPFRLLLFQFTVIPPMEADVTNTKFVIPNEVLNRVEAEWVDSAKVRDILGRAVVNGDIRIMYNNEPCDPRGLGTTEYVLAGMKLGDAFMNSLSFEDFVRHESIIAVQGAAV